MCRASCDIKSAAANMSMKFSAQWLGASCAGADKN